MDTIGSHGWLEKAEKEWSKLHQRDFDPVKAFRRDTLREVDKQRPRRWWGGIPWFLHDREQVSSLSSKFVAYLDNRLELHDWETRLHILKHQSLNWWAERLAELDNSES